MRLSIGYPDAMREKRILAMETGHEAVRQMEACLAPVELLKWMDQSRQVHVAPVVDDYLLSVVQATRAAEGVEVGVSPRGAIALRKAAQARALLQNRDHVTPDDIKALAVPVLAHRLIFASDQLEDLSRQSEQIIQNLLQNIP